ncbi:MAG: homocysteine S-methyltransferase family protein [Terriglobia bacterium]
MPVEWKFDKPRNALIERLVGERPVLTDGAWGTELLARGLGAGECPDVWNLEFPDRVLEIGRAYVEAGSRVILTNTFGANRIALERHGLHHRTREINQAGVEISLRAANGGALVFAAIGPSGKLLGLGEVTGAELQKAFVEQAEVLAAAGAAALVVETMSDLDEARLAVSAARATGLPVVACMAFDSGKTKTQTMMGTTAEEAAKALTEAGADAIGANCGQGVENYLQICQMLAAATDRPIWLKPNAGAPQLVGDRTVYASTPDEFAQAASALAEAGAAFIGGCCGTTPAFIHALASVL